MYEERENKLNKHQSENHIFVIELTAELTSTLRCWADLHIVVADCNIVISGLTFILLLLTLTLLCLVWPPNSYWGVENPCDALSSPIIPLPPHSILPSYSHCKAFSRGGITYYTALHCTIHSTALKLLHFTALTKLPSTVLYENSGLNSTLWAFSGAYWGATLVLDLSHVSLINQSLTHNFTALQWRGQYLTTLHYVFNTAQF